jgi:hypothetical protein
MRHHRTLLISVLTFTTAIFAAPSVDPKQEAANLEQGAYYWNGASWQAMQIINVSGGGTKHMAKMLVPGLTPQMVWTFRGPTAPVQVGSAKPLFCVKFITLQPGTPYAPSPRDIVIARFDEKKDHRELQTTSGGNVFTFKSGLPKDRTPDLDVIEVGQSTYFVSPKDSLANGEYILATTSLGISGYDFGFHQPK